MVVEEPTTADDIALRPPITKAPARFFILREDSRDDIVVPAKAGKRYLMLVPAVFYVLMEMNLCRWESISDPKSRRPTAVLIIGRESSTGCMGPTHIALMELMEELCWGEPARGFAALDGFGEAEVWALEVVPSRVAQESPVEVAQVVADQRVVVMVGAFFPDRAVEAFAVRVRVASGARPVLGIAVEINPLSPVALSPVPGAAAPITLSKIGPPPPGCVTRILRLKRASQQCLGSRLGKPRKALQRRCGAD